MLIPIQIKRRHPACIQPVQLETHADVEQREQIFIAVQFLQPEVPADIQRSETIPIQIHNTQLGISAQIDHRQTVAPARQAFQNGISRHIEPRQTTPVAVQFPQSSALRNIQTRQIPTILATDRHQISVAAQIEPAKAIAVRAVEYLETGETLDSLHRTDTGIMAVHFSDRPGLGGGKPSVPVRIVVFETEPTEYFVRDYDIGVVRRRGHVVFRTPAPYQRAKKQGERQQIFHGKTEIIRIMGTETKSAFSKLPRLRVPVKSLNLLIYKD